MRGDSRGSSHIRLYEYVSCIINNKYRQHIMMACITSHDVLFFRNKIQFNAATCPRMQTIPSKINPEFSI